jgi:DNA-binding winged helix-turn-helix (wHTH) protein
MNKQIDLQAGFYLEGWFVEPELARLTKDRKVVQLEPKIMSVLLMLAENQGKVVKKEQFFKTIWAEINVTEHVLARAISEIRRIFNDNPQVPRIIQTHSKNGYRLIAPVSTQPGEKTSQNAWEFKTANFLPQTALSINMTNLLFFLGGIFVMLVFIAMFFIIIMNKHGAGNFH